MKKRIRPGRIYISPCAAKFLVTEKPLIEKQEEYLGPAIAINCVRECHVCGWEDRSGIYVGVVTFVTISQLLLFFFYFYSQCNMCSGEVGMRETRVKNRDRRKYTLLYTVIMVPSESQRMERERESKR